MQNQESICTSCRKPKAQFECGLCTDPVCKSCVENWTTDRIKFLAPIPEELSHSRYCQFCFDQTVAPVLQEYEATLERAREVHFWPKSFKGHIHTVRKSEKEVTVDGAADRDEVTMHLAFVAAQKGYNAVIKAELTSQKVRNFGYQTTTWSGRALPAQIDEARVAREEYQEEVWRRGN